MALLWFLGPLVREEPRGPAVREGSRAYLATETNINYARRRCEAARVSVFPLKHMRMEINCAEDAEIGVSLRAPR